MVIMNEFKRLVLDVIYANRDKKSIKYVSANSTRVLFDITTEDLSAYLKQLDTEGWKFVHRETMDALYSVYYFHREINHP